MDVSSILLTPVASVDTTDCTVAMNALIPAQWFNNQTLIQVEYNIFDFSSSTSGFLSYEPGWFQAGILNQLTIGIPCMDEGVIDYTGNTKVKVRAYFGSKDTSHISVSDWSNVQPYYNSPAKPTIQNAYLSVGDSHSPPNDIMSVQLEYDPSYFSSPSDISCAVQFIVSYNYVDVDGTVQWIVTDLINGRKQSNGTDYAIVLNSFQLSSDASLDISNNPVHVAVNAVYEFSDENELNNYYSVSRISDTVQAQLLEPGAAFLNVPVYHIYDKPPADPSQTITLTWVAPAQSLFLQPLKYSLLKSVNGGAFTQIYEVSGNSTDLTYTWAIDPSTLYEDPTASGLQFIVNTYYSDAQYYTSNQQDIMTFSYASRPLGLSVRYAIPVAGGIQFAFSFFNPAKNGQGTSPKFHYNVYDGVTQAILSSGEIEYSSVATDYFESIFIENNTTTEYIAVQVYMETQNTNPDYEYLPGEPAIASSRVVAPPIVESIARNVVNQTISVIILSAEPLGLDNQFIYYDTVSQLLLNKKFQITNGDGYTVVVNNPTPLNQIYTYNYTFDLSFFTPSSLPSLLVVVASNTAGCGAGNGFF